MGDAGLAALHAAWQGTDPGDLARYLRLEACVARRDAVGGPAPRAVAEQIAAVRAFVGSRPGAAAAKEKAAVGCAT